MPRPRLWPRAVSTCSVAFLTMSKKRKSSTPTEAALSIAMRFALGRLRATGRPTKMVNPATAPSPAVAAKPMVGTSYSRPRRGSPHLCTR